MNNKNYLNLRNRLIPRTRLSNSLSFLNIDELRENQNTSLQVNNINSNSDNEISIINLNSLSSDNSSSSNINRSSLTEFYDSKLESSNSSDSVVFIDTNNFSNNFQNIKQEFKNCSYNLDLKIKKKIHKSMQRDELNYVLKFVPSLTDKDGLHKFCKCADTVWNPYKDKKDTETIKIKKNINRHLHFKTRRKSI